MADNAATPWTHFVDGCVALLQTLRNTIPRVYFAFIALGLQVLAGCFMFQSTKEYDSSLKSLGHIVVNFMHNHHWLSLVIQILGQIVIVVCLFGMEYYSENENVDNPIFRWWFINFFNICGKVSLPVVSLLIGIFFDFSSPVGNNAYVNYSVFSLIAYLASLYSSCLAFLVTHEFGVLGVFTSTCLAFSWYVKPNWLRVVAFLCTLSPLLLKAFLDSTDELMATGRVDPEIVGPNAPGEGMGAVNCVRFQGATRGALRGGRRRRGGRHAGGRGEQEMQPNE